MNRTCVQILLLAAAPAFAADYHKCTDANGVVTYTDKACEGGEGQVVEVKEPTKPAPAKKCKAPRPGTDEEVAAVRAALAETMFDVESARFADFVMCHEPPGVPTFCAELNGKNRFGAYVGFRSIVGTIEGGRAKVIVMDEAETSTAKYICDVKGMSAN